MARRFARVAVAGLSLAAAACGGADRGRPSGDPVEVEEQLDPCTAADGYEFQRIIDFEPMDPTTTMPFEVRECDPEASCNLNFNYDEALSPALPTAMTEGCAPGIHLQVEPQLNESWFYGRPTGELRCGEPEFATRITATNLAVCVGANGRQGWGGSMTITFAERPPGNADQPFDATQWDGFSFWARKASPWSKRSLIVSASDGYTAGIRNIEDPNGGEARSCDASGSTTVPDSEKCDGFGVALTLTDDWTFVPVRFDVMRQKGFGMPSPEGHLVKDDLVRLQFLISAGDWDVWIDDISFFRDIDP